MSNSAIGSSWDDVRKEIFTPEEIAESNLRVALVGEFIKARKEQGISQKKLEELRLISRQKGLFCRRRLDRQPDRKRRRRYHYRLPAAGQHHAKKVCCPSIRRHTIRFPKLFLRPYLTSAHLPCLPFLSRMRDKNGYHEKRVITKGVQEV